VGEREPFEHCCAVLRSGHQNAHPHNTKPHPAPKRKRFWETTLTSVTSTSIEVHRWYLAEPTLLKEKVAIKSRKGEKGKKKRKKRAYSTKKKKQKQQHEGKDRDDRGGAICPGKKKGIFISKEQPYRKKKP